MVVASSFWAAGTKWELNRVKILKLLESETVLEVQQFQLVAVKKVWCQLGWGHWRNNCSANYFRFKHFTEFKRLEGSFNSFKCVRLYHKRHKLAMASISRKIKLIWSYNPEGVQNSALNIQQIQALRRGHFFLVAREAPFFSHPQTFCPWAHWLSAGRNAAMVKKNERQQRYIHYRQGPGHQIAPLHSPFGKWSGFSSTALYSSQTLTTSDVTHVLWRDNGEKQPGRPSIKWFHE